ncbi:hypothetical protein B0T18DRAFT_411527 [Schizothecium vesticola]|uniref:PCI domain-containing protein n=1 Tax=Schizothecium vesticola TaxID=314040 RepID=A0AA40EVY2_9PEZI|nr:hypothetical protein B0T18DRAFT_411527 [Schizothecium vesticola]
MEHTKALNALEPFLALSKSATSPRAAVDLIERATSAPNTFIFTELLETPQIQALATAGDAYPHHLTLLQIFSYGTWASARETPDLPALNDSQKRKLRQLTLLTLARSAHRSADPSSPVLGYTSLLAALDLTDPQELEELVISAIYAGLLSAKLDPQHGLVRINNVAPLRDVAPGAVEGLLSSLRSWADRCDATLHSLEAQMSELRAAADRRAADAAAREDRAAALVDAEKKATSMGSNMAGAPRTLHQPPPPSQQQEQQAEDEPHAAAAQQSPPRRQQLPGLRPEPPRAS